MKTEVIKLNGYFEPEQIYFAVDRNAKTYAVLDSSLQNEVGRYCIAGLSKYHEITYKVGASSSSEKAITDGASCLKELSRYLKEIKEENETGLPMVSGGIGFLSYDLGCELEKIELSNPGSLNIPDVYFAFFANYIISDIWKKETYVTVTDHSCAMSADEIEAMLLKDGLISNRYGASMLSEKKTEIFDFMDKTDYFDKIYRVREYAAAGDIYVMNFTRQICCRSSRDPFEVFLRLRKQNPAPYGAFIKTEDWAVISSSPERFMKITGNQVLTKPMKGTRRRGLTDMEDRRMYRELSSSRKDRSELMMVTDLERNDMNRFCLPGSVRVERQFEIEPYATVFQMTTEVVGEKAEETDAVEAIRCMFPGGSVTGAPKHRAMEITEELEMQRRGLYTGCLGYLSANGDCDLNVIIRTPVYTEGCYLIGTGGGITFESDAQSEYEETRQKADAVLRSILKENE